MAVHLPEIIFLNNPLDALERVQDHLAARPDLSAIVLVHGASALSAENCQRLADALDTEQVVASEAHWLPRTVMAQFPLSLQPHVVSSITSPVSAFKVSVLRDYLDAIRSELGDQVSVTDMSIFLNRMGLSSVSVALPKDPDTAPLEVLLPASIPREWDGYIAHIRRFEGGNPADFFETFSSALDAHAPSRVLLDASGLAPQHNGTSRFVAGFVRDLDRALADHDLAWEVTLTAPAHSLEQLGIKPNRIHVAPLESDTEETFDLGVALTPLTSLQRCIDLTRTCLRWMVVHLDAIALRSLPHFSQQVHAREALRFYGRYADHVVFISNFSRSDAQDLLQESNFRSSSVCQLGVPDEFEPSESHTTDTIANRIFVLGNDNPHKQVDAATRQLLKAGFDVLSNSSRPPQSQNHTPIRPGTLTDTELRKLMLSASVLVFPSRYEGFGLPIVEAAVLGKPIVVWDSEISREVVDSLELKNVSFVRAINELPGAVLQAQVAAPLRAERVRRASEFDAQLFDEMTQLLHTDLDIEFVFERWRISALASAAAEERENMLRAALANRNAELGFFHRLGRFIKHEVSSRHRPKA